MKYINNFWVTLTEPMTAETEQLPVPTEALATIKTNKLRMTISNSATPKRGEFEIVELGQYGLIRGLEGTVALDWPAGALCYCSFTADYATMVTTPAFAESPDLNIELLGKSVAPIFSYDRGHYGRDSAVLTLEYQGKLGAAVADRDYMDYGAPLGIHHLMYSETEGEHIATQVVYNAPGPGEDTHWLCLIQKTTEGLLVDTLNYDSGKRTSALIPFGPNLPDQEYKSLANDISGHAVLMGGTKAYFFDIKGAEPELASSAEIEGWWAENGRPDFIKATKSMMSDPLYIDEDGVILRGEFAQGERCEIRREYRGLDDPFPAGVKLAIETSYGATVAAVTSGGNYYFREHGPLDLGVSGNIISLFGSQDQSNVLTDQGEHVVIENNPRGLAIISSGHMDHWPYPTDGFMRNSTASVLYRENYNGTGELMEPTPSDMENYGGLIQDGYMPGDKLRELLGRIRSLEYAVQHLGEIVDSLGENTPEPEPDPEP